MLGWLREQYLTSNINFHVLINVLNIWLIIHGLGDLMMNNNDGNIDPQYGKGSTGLGTIGQNRIG